MPDWRAARDCWSKAISFAFARTANLLVDWPKFSLELCCWFPFLLNPPYKHSHTKLNPSTNEKKTLRKSTIFCQKQKEKVRQKGIEQYLFRRAKNGSCRESIRSCHFTILFVLSQQKRKEKNRAESARESVDVDKKRRQGEVKLGFSFIMRYLASRTFFHFVEPLRSSQYLSDFLSAFMFRFGPIYKPHPENRVGFCVCTRKIVVKLGLVMVD